MRIFGDMGEVTEMSFLRLYLCFWTEMEKALESHIIFKKGGKLEGWKVTLRNDGMCAITHGEARGTGDRSHLVSCDWERI